MELRSNYYGSFQTELSIIVRRNSRSFCITCLTEVTIDILSPEQTPVSNLREQIVKRKGIRGTAEGHRILI